MFSLVRENIRIAVNSIKSQLLRTILTVLIIAIGITALVGILSAISALENTISGDFSSMGSNTFNIQREEFAIQRHGGGRIQKQNPIISYADANDFINAYQFPLSQVSLSFTGTRSAEIKYESEKTDPDVLILGANENFIQNSGLKINQGREFTVFDVDNNNNVCVIANDIVEEFFKDLNPINKTISIRGHKFKVIGTLESKKTGFNSSEDNRIIIPIKLARSIFTNPNINYNLSIKVDKKELLDNAKDEAIYTFRNVRKLKPIEKNNFAIESSEDLANRVASMTKYLYMAAWVISIITIFGSSIALMNIMLVTVSERTREIGVRKALGAKRKTISTQFFIETIIVGQMGGVLGIILGLLIGFAVSSAAGFNFTTPWKAMFTAVAISFIVALISGLMPAIKASKLDPIESLRYE
ncbi:ABC transporter permease [Yeosuana marina]|uniref:ABC transporter permease n=1 Tax=Yeosuana marina TaxID=1565536 RepID=UPI001423C90F|nr:ABC transporter permease [Yeosuana marina]|tara:strand:+ start:11238 stop:12479 length:1242 start_codon:yes stop_codon:yes gene_type:complete